MPGIRNLVSKQQKVTDKKRAYLTVDPFLLTKLNKYFMINDVSIYFC